MEKNNRRLKGTHASERFPFYHPHHLKPLDSIE